LLFRDAFNALDNKSFPRSDRQPAEVIKLSDKEKEEKERKERQEQIYAAQMSKLQAFLASKGLASTSAALRREALLKGTVPSPLPQPISLPQTRREGVQHVLSPTAHSGGDRRILSPEQRSRLKEARELLTKGLHFLPHPTSPSCPDKSKEKDKDKETPKEELIFTEEGYAVVNVMQSPVDETRPSVPNEQKVHSPLRRQTEGTASPLKPAPVQKHKRRKAFSVCLSLDGTLLLEAV
jgi:hypothetical protein